MEKYANVYIYVKQCCIIWYGFAVFNELIWMVSCGRSRLRISFVAFKQSACNETYIDIIHFCHIQKFICYLYSFM